MKRIPHQELAAFEADPENALNAIMLPGIDPSVLSQFAELPEGENQAAFMQAFENMQSDPSTLQLDKVWHAISFLVSGDPNMAPSDAPGQPLWNAINGGQDTSVDAGYGPARWHSAEEVSAISAALDELNFDEVGSRCSAAALNAADIYPSAPYWTDDEAPFLLELCEEMRSFFRDAKAAGEVVLIISA